MADRGAPTAAPHRASGEVGQCLGLGLCASGQKDAVAGKGGSGAVKGMIRCGVGTLRTVVCLVAASSGLDRSDGSSDEDG